MLVIGAKGFAKEVLEIIVQNGDDENLCFYDDITPNFPDLLYNKYKVLKSEKEAKNYFEKVDNRFIIGIGNPSLRAKMYEKFTNLKGKPTTIISKNAEISSFGVEIGDACIVMSGVKISNDTKIQRGTMIYYNSVVTHDVKVGEFCEISPSVNILGGAKIGNKCHLATNSVIFPQIKVGNNTVIAAGSVVRENIPNNVMVAGIPAIIKKHF
ncbi:MAG: acetyltransferase [Petrimonas sp.]|jgi:sugar O-acyltransferase (sialic acid O-acetyltransferase NeuD family)